MEETVLQVKKKVTKKDKCPYCIHSRVWQHNVLYCGKGTMHAMKCEDADFKYFREVGSYAKE